MRSNRWGMLALACAVGVLPACGGDAGAGTTNDAKGSPGASATASMTAPPASGAPSGTTSSGAPGSSTAPTGAASASGRPGATPSATTPSPTPTQKIARLDARLDKQCATPGSTQTLHIGTAPKPKDGDPMIVVFDTLYADGKDGQVYGGIEKNGRANNEGKYVNTWVVALNTPLGQARVDIAVAGSPGTNTKHLYFDVKRTC